MFLHTYNKNKENYLRISSVKLGGAGTEVATKLDNNPDAEKERKLLNMIKTMDTKKISENVEKLKKGDEDEIKKIFNQAYIFLSKLAPGESEKIKTKAIELLSQIIALREEVSAQNKKEKTLTKISNPVIEKIYPNEENEIMGGFENYDTNELKDYIKIFDAGNEEKIRELLNKTRIFVPKDDLYHYEYIKVTAHRIVLEILKKREDQIAWEKEFDEKIDNILIKNKFIEDFIDSSRDSLQKKLRDSTVPELKRYINLFEKGNKEEIIPIFESANVSAEKLQDSFKSSDDTRGINAFNYLTQMALDIAMKALWEKDKKYQINKKLPGSFPFGNKRFHTYVHEINSMMHSLDSEELKKNIELFAGPDTETNIGETIKILKINTKDQNNEPVYLKSMAHRIASQVLWEREYDYMMGKEPIPNPFSENLIASLTNEIYKKLMMMDTQELEKSIELFKKSDDMNAVKKIFTDIDEKNFQDPNKFKYLKLIALRLAQPILSEKTKADEKKKTLEKAETEKEQAANALKEAEKKREADRIEAEKKKVADELEKKRIADEKIELDKKSKDEKSNKEKEENLKLFSTVTGGIIVPMYYNTSDTSSFFGKKMFSPVMEEYKNKRNRSIDILFILQYDDTTKDYWWKQELQKLIKKGEQYDKYMPTHITEINPAEGKKLLDYLNGKTMPLVPSKVTQPKGLRNSLNEKIYPAK